VAKTRLRPRIPNSFTSAQAIRRRSAVQGISSPEARVTAFFKALKEGIMIRKLSDGSYRLYSRKKNPKTGKRRNLGTFETRAGAEKHEREVQYFKQH
jgi:hypothetical protein